MPALLSVSGTSLQRMQQGTRDSPEQEEHTWVQKAKSRGWHLWQLQDWHPDVTIKLFLGAQSFASSQCSRLLHQAATNPARFFRIGNVMAKDPCLGLALPQFWASKCVRPKSPPISLFGRKTCSPAALLPAFMSAGNSGNNRSHMHERPEPVIEVFGRATGSDILQEALHNSRCMFVTTPLACVPAKLRPAGDQVMKGCCFKKKLLIAKNTVSGHLGDALPVGGCGIAIRFGEKLIDLPQV